MLQQATVELQGLTWQVAPDDDDTLREAWDRCRAAWLAAKSRRSGSGHTRRAYETAVDQFTAWAQGQGLAPWQVSRAAADGWAEHLAAVQGLAASTVNARLAALSSFYTFAMEVFVMRDQDGVEQPLHRGANPFRAVERPQVQAYGRAIYPSQEEAARLLGALDLDTARGWRDRAIILGLLTMAQRFNAWLTVRWGQIVEGDTGTYFEYRAKGGLVCKAAIHEPVMQAVEEWLHRSGRWPLAPSDFVFVAEDPERAGRLPGVEVFAGNSQPLSNSTVNGMLQALARRAGVDPVKVHAHGLRHAGARWMRRQGADVWDLQRILGHKSISTTQIYVEEVLDEPSNEWGAEIARQLSLF